MSRPLDLEMSVAVVGMACRLPGARDPGTYLANLLVGGVSISRFGASELEERSDHPRYVPSRGILGDVDQFDPDFFGYTLREAEVLDPQHRIALECCWEVLEQGGHAIGAAAGTTGVFLSANLSTYLIRNLLPNEGLVQAVGPALIHQSNVPDQVAARAAYRLGLTGPVLTVQTACSSSLVAVHLAVQSLLTEECDAALAGGVSIVLPERAGYVHQPGGLTSPDGAIHALDARANGTVFSNGAGVVLLKRLSDALADRDPVHAVIRGTAIGNDGAGKVGFVAPSVGGQAAVIRAALAAAGVAPSDLGFVETHGTGTRLGDPIEIAALSQVFATDRAARPAGCVLGSVKPNIGHLDNAAGIAGLLKVTLAVRDGVVPGTANFASDSAHAPLDGTPFRVTSSNVPFPADRPRRAGVSAFGVGGTNCHVVVEEHVRLARTPDQHPAELAVVCAPTEAQLDALVAALAAHADGHPELRLSDLARTLAGRPLRGIRRAATGRDPRAVIADLGRARSAPAPSARPTVAFVFPGQGTTLSAALPLAARFAPFARALDDCAAVLAPWFDLRAVLADGPARSPEAQPALFSVEYALAELWRSAGLVPDLVLGHSLGEYAAACVAGSLPVADALRLLVRRGELVDETGPGAMLAVALDAERIRLHLGDGVELAAVNGLDQVVVSGRVGPVEALRRALTALGIASVPLPVQRALHSAALDPILDRFADAVRAACPGPAKLPMISSRTGDWCGPESHAVGAWVAHLREPVQFARAWDTLRAAAPALVFELGPAAGLARDGAIAVLPAGRDPVDGVLGALAAAVEAGATVDLATIGTPGAHRVALPVVPLARIRCFVDPPDARPAAAPISVPLLVTPSWTRLPAAPPDRGPRRSVAVFTNGSSLGVAVVDRLEELGHATTTVRPGPGFGRLQRGAYEARPGSTDDLQALLAELRGLAMTPSWILHLYNAEDVDPGDVLLDALAVVRAADAVGRATELSVSFVAAGVHDVLGDEPLTPHRAVLAGVARVASQELRSVSCRLVDVCLRGEDPVRVAERVVDELDRPGREREVALRGAGRWLRRYDPVLRTQTPPISGTVLVTGGTGGVGIALAEALADAGCRSLVLAARTATGADDRAEIAALRARGVAVRLVDTDVADRASLSAAVTLARGGPGGLSGVVHAAGIAGGGLLVTRTDAQVRAVTRPKLDGARLLLELVADDRPGFVSLCSSTAGWLGGLGQADYAAANAGLDALARSARRDGLRVVSVAWDTWRGVGLAIGDTGSTGVDAEANGLSVDEARALFLGTLASPLAEIGAVRGSMAERVADAERARLPAASPTPAAAPRNLDGLVLPRNEVESAVATVFRELLGASVIGVDDDFFALGGQSLLVSQAVGRLRDLFEVDLPVLALFEGRTVAEVSARIEELLLETPGGLF